MVAIRLREDLSEERAVAEEMRESQSDAKSSEALLIADLLAAKSRHEKEIADLKDQNSNLSACGPLIYSHQVEKVSAASVPGQTAFRRPQAGERPVLREAVEVSAAARELGIVRCHRMADEAKVSADKAKGDSTPGVPGVFWMVVCEG